MFVTLSGQTFALAHPEILEYWNTGINPRFPELLTERGMRQASAE